jgi:hypothetical protein
VGYKSTWSADAFHVHVFGEFSTAELKRTYEELCSSPNLDRIRYFLKNLANTTSVTYCVYELEEVAYTTAVANHYKRNLLGAYVIGESESEPLLEKFIDHLKAAGCRWKIRIFKDTESAYDWLSSEAY